jgi:hypothetical protein
MIYVRCGTSEVITPPYSGRRLAKKRDSARNVYRHCGSSRWYRPEMFQLVVLRNLGSPLYCAQEQFQLLSCSIGALIAPEVRSWGHCYGQHGMDPGRQIDDDARTGGFGICRRALFFRL